MSSRNHQSQSKSSRHLQSQSIGSRHLQYIGSRHPGISATVRWCAEDEGGPCGWHGGEFKKPERVRLPVLLMRAFDYCHDISALRLSCTSVRHCICSPPQPSRWRMNTPPSNPSLYNPSFFVICCSFHCFYAPQLLLWPFSKSFHCGRVTFVTK